MEIPPQVDVAVVGGAAGAAIAHKLAEQGRSVALLFRDGVQGATDTNQKWLHSGLLYPNAQLASKAWDVRNRDWNIKKNYITGCQSAYILTLKNNSAHQREDMWNDWRKEGLDIPATARLTYDKKSALSRMGIKFTAGWTSPDFAIDLPRIFTDMRSDLSGQLTDNSIFTTIKRTVHFIATSEMTEIDIQDINITGLKFIIDGNEYRISCKNCVLATGAWTTDILSKIAINLPIIRREFLILVVKKEHFDINNIIICLDVDKEDGNGTGDVTIAPFGDSILAANADFKVVYNQKDRKIENYSWGRSELEALKCGLYQCFTKIGTLTDADYNVRLCFKTEQFNSFYPDVDLKIYTE